VTTAVAAPPLSVGAALHPRYLAFDIYLDHRDGCMQCRASLFRCPAGEELWEAFKAVSSADH